MENEIFDLVQKAQAGDKEAMIEIITMFMPAIRSAKNKLKKDQQDDLEQYLAETIMRKILTYDVSQTPDLSAFYRQLNDMEPNKGPKK